MDGNKRTRLKRSTRFRSSKGLPKTIPPRTAKIDDFIGCLTGKTKKIATIEEINQAAAEGWAGLVKMGK